MGMKESHPLSEQEELLLSQYFDGECSFFARRRAQRLLLSNPLAQTFLDNLSAVGSECRALAESRADTVDLWARISTRIDAEEKAAFYLGERRESASQSILSRVRPTQALFGGLSGAVVAAAVLVFVAAPADKVQNSPSPSASAFKQAAIGAFEARPAAFQAQAKSAMEVDWMRSNGSVKLIQNPAGKSATIWVRRKKASDSAVSLVQVTPAFQATPYLSIDEQRQELSK